MNRIVPPFITGLILALSAGISCAHDVTLTIDTDKVVGLVGNCCPYNVNLAALAAAESA